eukprot:365053-Chlamydomonas_euryale.AAC.30
MAAPVAAAAASGAAPVAAAPAAPDTSLSGATAAAAARTAAAAVAAAAAAAARDTSMSSPGDSSPLRALPHDAEERIGQGLVAWQQELATHVTSVLSGTAGAGPTYAPQAPPTPQAHASQSHAAPRAHASQSHAAPRAHASQGHAVSRTQGRVSTRCAPSSELRAVHPQPHFHHAQFVHARRMHAFACMLADCMLHVSGCASRHDAAFHRHEHVLLYTAAF